MEAKPTMETPAGRGGLTIITEDPLLRTTTEVRGEELPETSIFSAKKIQSLLDGMLNSKHMALMGEQWWKHLKNWWCIQYFWEMGQRQIIKDAWPNITQAWRKNLISSSERGKTHHQRDCRSIFSHNRTRDRWGRSWPDTGHTITRWGGSNFHWRHWNFRRRRE